MTPESASSRIYTDFSGLQKLKVSARAESPEAVKAVAKEFEASFVEMMLKSLRDASSGEGIMDGEGSRMYQDMFDKQISVDISERGDFGIASVIEAQLTKGKSQQMPVVDVKPNIEKVASLSQNPAAGNPLVQNPAIQNPFNLTGLNNKPKSAQFPDHNVPQRREIAIQPITVKPVIEKVTEVKPIIDLKQAGAPIIYDHKIAQPITAVRPQQPERTTFKTPDEFIQTMRPHAERAAREIGVDPDLLIAQAALETGWGKRVIKNSDGTNSHNLFGIKASRAWDGDSVNVGSLEYRNGVAKKEVSAFRSYSSFTESFNDYVDFIKNQSRYDNAVDQAGNRKEYIKGLQTAGYATDPNYANKVMDILERKSLQAAWKGNA